MSIFDKWPKDVHGIMVMGPKEIMDMVSDVNVSDHDKELMLLMNINFWLGLQWQHFQMAAKWQQETILPFIKQSQKLDKMMDEEQEGEEWKEKL